MATAGVKGLTQRVRESAAALLRAGLTVR